MSANSRRTPFFGRRSAPARVAAAAALDALAVAHPNEVEAIRSHLRDLRSECAHWRTEARKARGEQDQ